MNSITTLASIIVDETKPISQRIDAVFELKDSEPREEALSSLNAAFCSPSVLLTHELAYIMGQMQDPKAIPYLEKVLDDSSTDCITRHEAAEALAAIGDISSLSCLQRHVADTSPHVSQSCSLAIDTLNFKIKNRIAGLPSWPQSSKYSSMDPAPPSGDTDLALLEATFLGTTCDRFNLFQRYSALFQLRELGSPEAVQIISMGLSMPFTSLCTDGTVEKDGEDVNALFKHEVAYVLGQIKSKLAIDALEKTLENTQEHSMAAEALGAISGKRAKAILERFVKDPDRIVSESCLVGLGIAETWTAAGED